MILSVRGCHSLKTAILRPTPQGEAIPTKNRPTQTPRQQTAPKATRPDPKSLDGHRKHPHPKKGSRTPPTKPTHPKNQTPTHIIYAITYYVNRFMFIYKTNTNVYLST